MPDEEQDPVLSLLHKIREQIDDVVNLVQEQRDDGEQHASQ